MVMHSLENKDCQQHTISRLLNPKSLSSYFTYKLFITAPNTSLKLSHAGMQPSFFILSFFQNSIFIQCGHHRNINLSTLISHTKQFSPKLNWKSETLTFCLSSLALKWFDMFHNIIDNFFQCSLPIILEVP